VRGPLRESLRPFAGCESARLNPTLSPHPKSGLPDFGTIWCASRAGPDLRCGERERRRRACEDASIELGLPGKRALVTGASKGIGLAIAQALAAEGCRVDIAGRTPAALDQAADAIRKTTPGAVVQVHRADLGVLADQEQLAASCAADDILVNNAGAAAAGSLDERATPAGASRGTSRCSATSTSRAPSIAR
jgi:hypothetical protein